MNEIYGINTEISDQVMMDITKAADLYSEEIKNLYSNIINKINTSFGVNESSALISLIESYKDKLEAGEATLIDVKNSFVQAKTDAYNQASNANLDRINKFDL